MANAMHLAIIGFALIGAGREDDADRLLARFIARSPRERVLGSAYFTQTLFDLRLYIHTGRGNVAEVLRLLDARPSSRGSSCHSAVRNMFPDVVAPLHRDPRVAAKLRALGCSERAIARLDTLTEPLGASPFSPRLPPRTGARN